MEAINEQTVKGYQLKECLGEGAYGAVYRATQPQVRREVAIKIILPEYANRPEFIRRFETEAQLVAQLEHMNIAPLYDYWREPDGAYLVMRLLKGGSLADSLRENGPWEPLEAVQLVDQIASALDAAHQHGVVHRDLKPANILLDEDGNAYLSDFGIAKELGAESGLTQTGAILGTPAYITPEQVQSQAVTPQTDIYALGVVLYELLTGEHPFADAPTGALIVKHVNEPLPLVWEKCLDLPVEVDQVIQKATAKDPAGRYLDALTMAAELRRALQLEVALPIVPEGEITNPYKGLRAFQEADADDFFGREVLTGQLLARLAEISSLEGGGKNRFLAVVGPSGSGKSSAVKAGLLPALRKGALPGSEGWYITEMVPGAYPLEELELALLRIAVKEPPSLLGQLKEDARGLLRATRRVLPEEGELLLIVDQLEEVFTLVEDPKQSYYFLQSLYEAVVDPRSPVRVVVTLRADFYDRPLMHPDFSELMQKRTEVVVPLKMDELERAIRAPVERVGILMEKDLIPTITADVVDQPGALPLLQYALTELFERREGRILTSKAYHSIGGVLGALGRRAEEVCGGLDQDGKDASRQLFLRLVALGEGAEDTRRRVLRAELEGLIRDKGQGIGIREVIDDFGKARLLTFDHDLLTRGSTVEVAHEALLREWPRLREWLDESRADLRMQRVLGNATAEWLAANQDSSFLLRGTRLAQFEDWVKIGTVALTQDEHAFLEASLDARQARQTAEAKRRQRELEQVSVGLASQALQEIEGGAPERSVLLALEALEHYPYTWQAERALGQAVLKNRLRFSLIHDNHIRSAQWSSDGSKILTAAQDGTARIWDALSGEELTRITEGEPIMASWSPKERFILAVNEKETIVKVWQADSGSEHLSLNYSDIGSKLNLNTVGWKPWSPKRDRFLIYSLEGSMKIWDAETGEVLQTLCGHQDRVTQAHWSPDGEQIVSSSVDGTVILWHAETAHAIYRISTDQKKFVIGGWSPAGERFTTRGTGEVRVYEAASGKQLMSLPYPETKIWGATWSPDGAHILISAEDGIARIVDADSGQELDHMSGFVQAIGSNWSDSGDYAAVGGIDGFIRVWDTKRRMQILKLMVSSYPFFVDFSPDGKLLLAAGYQDIIVKVFELSEADLNISIPPGWISVMAWSPDGDQIACGFENGDIRVWDSINGEEKLMLTGHTAEIVDVDWSHSGDRIVTTSEDLTARIWSAGTAEQLLTFTGHQNTVFGAQWSHNDKKVASNDHDGKVIVWDPTNGEQLLTFSGHQGVVNTVSWSPDDALILSTGFCGEAMIWNASTGKLLLNLFQEEFDLEITTGVWTKDGKQVVLKGADGSLHFFDSGTGELVKQFETPGWGGGIHFSPTEERVMTCSDGTIRIWNTNAGEELLSYEIGGFVETAYSPDGKRILIGSNTGIIQIFPTWHSAQELIEYAREHCVFRDLTAEERKLFGLPERGRTDSPPNEDDPNLSGVYR